MSAAGSRWTNSTAVERAHDSAFAWCRKNGLQVADAEDIAQEAAVYRVRTEASKATGCWGRFKRRVAPVVRWVMSREATISTDRLDRLESPNGGRDDRVYAVRYAFSRLAPRDQKAVLLVLEEPTFEAAGRRFGLTRERMRQMWYRSLGEMKRYIEIYESESEAISTRTKRFGASVFRKTPA